jgi:hypothetical protein
MKALNTRPLELADQQLNEARNHLKASFEARSDGQGEHGQALVSFLEAGERYQTQVRMLFGQLSDRDEEVERYVDQAIKAALQGVVRGVRSAR